LIVPTVVIGGSIFRLYFYNEQFRWLLGTIPGVVGPHVILALPYMVIVLAATLRGADETQEYTAMSLGANRFTTFRRVVIPQILPGVIIAGLLAFLVSFNEVVIALFLKTREFQTLPMNIWGGRTAEYAPMMAAASTLMMLAAGALLLGAVLSRRQLARRRL